MKGNSKLTSTCVKNIATLNQSLYVRGKQGTVLGYLWFVSLLIEIVHAFQYCTWLVMSNNWKIETSCELTVQMMSKVYK